MSQSNDFQEAFDKLHTSMDRLNETLVHGFAIISQELTELRSDVQSNDARIEYLTDAVCDRLGVLKGNAKPTQPRPGIGA